MNTLERGMAMLKCLILQAVLNTLLAQDLISVWSTDTNGRLDASKDMNLSPQMITQRFLYQEGAQLQSVSSNNNVRYFLPSQSANPSPSITFLTSTIVPKVPIANAENIILYQSVGNTGSIFRQNRNVTTKPPTTDITTDSLEIVSSLKSPSAPLPSSASLNCFDARMADATTSAILILCKGTYIVSSQSMARLVAFRYQTTGDTLKQYVSEEYANDKPTFQTVAWSAYSRSTSSSIADSLENILIVTDLDGTTQPAKWIMMVGSFVTNQTSREFNISRRIPIDATIPNAQTFVSLTQTVKIFSATITYTFINTTATKTSRNLIMIGYTEMPQPNQPQNTYYCWEESSGTNSPLDKMIMSETSYTKIQMKCGPGLATQPGNHSMSRIAKLTNDTDFFLKIVSNRNATTDVVTVNYNIMRTKPVDINVATMTIPFDDLNILSNTITVPGFKLYPKIFSAVENKVFYACWRDSDFLDQLDKPCLILDIFWVNSTAYTDGNTNSYLTTFRLVKREYGAFTSVAFDFDNTTNTTNQLLTTPEFKSGTLATLSRKVVGIYNMNLTSYSIAVPAPSNPAQESNITFKLGDVVVSNTTKYTQQILAPTGTKNVWMNFSNTEIWVPFKDKAPTLIGYFRNNVFFGSGTDISISSSGGITTTFYKLYKFELAVTPNPSSGLILAVDRVLIELYTGADGTNYVITKNFNIQANTAATPTFSVSGTSQLGTWSSKDVLFKPANLKKAEKFESGGLFLYFYDGSSRYGVVRMDIYNPDVNSYRNSTKPLLIFETKSTCIILSLVNPEGPILQLDQLDDSKARNISADVSALNKTITTTLVGPNLVIRNLDDVGLEIYNTGQTVVVNFVADVKGYSDISMVTRVAWTNRSTLIQAANTLEIEYQKLIDLPFLAATKDKPRCVYNNSVVFMQYDTTSATVYVYNASKQSYFTKSYTLTGPPTLACMGQMVAIAYPNAGKTITEFLTIQGELRAVNRVRDVLQDSKVDIVPFGFSAFSAGRRIDTNKIYLLQAEMNNLYVAMNYPATTIDPTVTIVNSPDATIKDLLNSELRAIDTVIKSYRLVKPEHMIGPAVYIGNETLEAQKKILYEANLQQTYRIEDTYRIPTSFFDVSLETSELNKIVVLKRIREIKNPFNLWNDSVLGPSTQSRCNFSLRGIEDVAIINDVMLRVDSRDDGFCMEISRITITDSLTVLQTDYMIQQGASVSDCKLIGDKSYSNSSTWDSLLKSGVGHSFVITCIYSEKEKNYLWALFITVQQTVQNIFKPKTNLLKMEIKHKFTYYKAMMINNYLYFGFYDASSRKVFYIRDLINTLNLDAPIIENTLNSTGLELAYFPPSLAGDKPQVGIWLLYCDIAVTNGLESYRLNTMKMLANSSIASTQQLPTDQNQLKWLNATLNQSIANISCASMTYSNASTNLMSCAYILHSSRNVLFYSFGPAPLANSTGQNYVAPYADFEIRQVKVFFWNGAFAYITLTFSPLSGKKYLMMYRHDLNRTTSDSNPHNVSVYTNSSLLLYGTIDLSNTSMDLNNVEINYFTIGTDTPKFYIGIHDDKYMRIYQITNLEITIDSNIQFSQISSSKLWYINHLGDRLSMYSLDEFFREKKGFTMLLVWVLLASLGITGLLVALYMTFKKKPKIDESASSLKELRNMSSGKQSDLNCSINLESGY